MKYTAKSFYQSDNEKPCIYIISSLTSDGNWLIITMSLFSQSQWCFGENTLVELEKGAALQPVKTTTTPNRSNAFNNSDSDIIEESPTSVSTGYSLRERTRNKHSIKPKTKSNLTTKDSSCEKITNVEPTFTQFNALSQLMRSEFDFDIDFVQILPENLGNVNNNDCDEVKENLLIIEDVSITETSPIKENVQPFEEDMFEDMVAVKKDFPTKSITDVEANEQKENSIWDDSFDFNDVNLSCGDNKDNNEFKLNLNVDEQMVLGLDNVTFTQVFLNEPSLEDDPKLESISNIGATSKFIEEEMVDSEKQMTQFLHEVCGESPLPLSSQMNSSRLNISESSFKLNYSQSTEENDEKQLAPAEKPKPQPLKLNSIDSWGKMKFSLILKVFLVHKNIFELIQSFKESLFATLRYTVL